MTLPRCGISMPASTCRRVVLPDPDGPVMARRAPAGIANASISRTGGTWSGRLPKARRTPVRLQAYGLSDGAKAGIDQPQAAYKARCNVNFAAHLERSGNLNRPVALHERLLLAEVNDQNVGRPVGV